MSNIFAKKSLGQNFLTDKNIIGKIVSAIRPNQKDIHIIEIGPGKGALTQELLAQGGKITVIEKDERMLEPLTELQNKFPEQLEIFIGDALEINWQEFLKERNLLTVKPKLVGNLPYNVGTQIVFNAIQTTFDKSNSGNLFESMTFMLQKEVIDRITAKEKSKQWGKLGVWCDLLTERYKLFDVPPTAFTPQPKIISSIVHLKPLAEPRYAVEVKKFERILKLSFEQRRKMLRSSLKSVFTEEEIEALEISAQARPETLNTEEFARLANGL